MSLRVADLFCGTGGFSHGFSQTGGYKTVLGIDIKPSSIATFSANHMGALALCSDIRQVKLHDIADQLGGAHNMIDVVIAGPPCQGFSSIRPFRSINENDMRNNLFEHLILFIDFFRPRFVVFENVVGLISHMNGKILSEIRDSIDDLGYRAALRVLNAVHYGVPQRRERIVILACRDGHEFNFPEPSHYFSGRSMAGQMATETLPLFAQDLPPAVTVNEAIGDLPPIEAGQEAIVYSSDSTPSAYAKARRNDTGTLTLHSATRHTPRMLEIIRQAGTNRWALPEGITTSGFSSCYSRLLGNEPSTTITVNFVHPASNRCIHPDQDRALTPREGARLQSFDDDYHFCGSRTEIVKQIGEAVPPLLGRSIAKAILKQI